MLTWQFIRLKDVGIVGHLLDREFWKLAFREREHYRNLKPEEVNIPISLDQIIGTSFIVLAGFVSSIISLLIEHRVIRNKH